MQRSAQKFRQRTSKVRRHEHAVGAVSAPDRMKAAKDSDRPDTSIGHDILCRLQGARSTSRATSERITTLQPARHVATAC